VRDLTKAIARNRRKDRIFRTFALFLLLLTLVVLGLLLAQMIMDGWKRIDTSFITSFPSRFAERAGVVSAIVGSIYVLFVTALSAIPLGIAAAIYLEEYAPKNRWTTLIELNINNLAGVPSIVYGLLALGVLVRQFHLGSSISAAGITLALLILPIIIVTSREAIRAVPVTMREAALACGATKWQTTKDHVVPYASGGILTGIIIALSRAVGETAPLITIGALSYIAFLPASPVTTEAPFVNFEWLSSGFTVLPIQMFNWVSRPQPEFHVNAAAAGVILMVVAMTMNACAVVLRNHFRRKYHW
jgi:phosphate transport system permease protein